MIQTQETSASDAEASRRRVVRDLRRANTLLCLWRVCGSATCRRARCCRGRAHLCARRNDGLLPEPVRDFFLSFLAAQYAGVSFKDFRDAMEGREETKAFFAWREACAARRRWCARMAHLSNNRRNQPAPLHVFHAAVGQCIRLSRKNNRCQLQG